MTQSPGPDTSFLRKMLDAASDGLVAVDASGRILEYNARFLDIFGLPRKVTPAGREDLRTAAAGRVVSPRDFRWNLAPRSDRPESNPVVTLVLDDGREVEAQAGPLEAGVPSMLWCFRDLTAFKTDAARWGQGNEWFRVTLASIGDAVITTDTQARVTYLNAVAERMTGWSEREARGRPLTEVFRIVHELTGAPAVNPVERVLAEGATIGLANHTALIHRDGHTVAIEDSAAPIRDATGRIVGTVMVFHDVDARRQAERARARSEQMLADFFEHAPVGLNWIAADGRILRANRSELQLIGCAESEYVGRRWPEFHVDPADGEEMVRHLAAGGTIENRPARLRRCDGSVREVLISGNAFIEDGRFIHARCFCRDVTEQNRAEAAQAHLAAIVASSDDAIVSKNLNGVIQTWNGAAERIFGYTAEEAVGKPITLVIPQDRLDEEPRILDRLKRGERVDHFETVRRRKDGRLIDISLTISPIFNDRGQIIGASKTARDITERVQAERALHEEHVVTEQMNMVAQALATELDLTRIVQVITDAGTRITRAQFGAFFYNRVDETGEAYTLYTLSGVDRSKFDKFPMPRATKLFAPTFRGEGVIRLDDVRRDPRFGQNEPHHGMPPGHLPVASYLAVPVFAAHTGEVLGGLFFGHAEPGVFTERDEKIVVAVAAQAAAAMNTARLYEAERRARAAAESASETKDRFIAALSHELRTPLTPVLAILSGLQGHPALPPAVAEDLETARQNVLLEARLIDDLLDLTRIARGKFSLEQEVVFVERLIETAVNTCRPDLESRELDLVRDLRAPSATVLGDSARLAQVLWNVIKNAIKFTPDGGTITVRSRLHHREAGDAVVIEVEDTGVGIAPEALPRIFSAFDQGGEETTRRFGGLGLGLAISQAIIQAHNGKLEAASPGRNQGSTFTLTLPLIRRPTPSPRRESSVIPPTASHPATPSRRILLVEDHADTAAVLRRLLQSWGHTVLHATSVADATRLAEQEMAGAGLDLVISDLGLPDGSGLDLMRSFSRRYSLTGIALSGYGMESDVKQSTAAGFARHLTKPIDLHMLRSAIHAIAAGQERG